MIEILSVSRVAHGDLADLLHVGCVVAINGVEETLERHAYRESDPYGLGPVIKEWLADHPDVTVHPFIPKVPTQGELRAHMPALSARQFRLGLVAGGFMPSQVTQMIDAMPDGQQKETAKIEWEYATTFNRMHPLISVVREALGLTDEQIDTMWAAALDL
ncbi:hypothetical protein [Ensifer canadensis]